MVPSLCCKERKKHTSKKSWNIKLNMWLGYRVLRWQRRLAAHPANTIHLLSNLAFRNWLAHHFSCDIRANWWSNQWCGGTLSLVKWIKTTKKTRANWCACIECRFTWDLEVHATVRWTACVGGQCTHNVRYVKDYLCERERMRSDQMRAPLLFHFCLSFCRTKIATAHNEYE